MIRISFFSNFFNLHQLPVARELNAMDDVQYTFISLIKTDGVAGRRPLDYDYPFVLREYEGTTEAIRAMCHAVEDEIVVFGDMAGKERYVRTRAKTGKLFFRYSERLLKRGDLWRFAPPKIIRAWNRFTKYKDANMYVLCAGAYVSRDLDLFGFPVEKCLKWGYFPEVETFRRNGTSPMNHRTLCSVQRLVSWKRVDLQIRLASLLKREGHDFELCVAGGGPCRSKLEALAKTLDVTDRVTFLGSLTHDQVIALMRSSEIFLATSNRREGWGATINEALASGCCVVACRDMGAAPYLIQDGVNGLLFDDSSLSHLHRQVSFLFGHTDAIARMSTNAVSQLSKTWSPEIASRAFYDFSMSALDSIQHPAQSGPMSKAY